MTSECGFPFGAVVSIENPSRNINKYDDKKFPHLNQSQPEFHINTESAQSLIDKMKPIVVEDLEHITGVLGFVESDTFSQEDTAREKPKDGALLTADVGMYLEENVDPIDCSCCKKRITVLKLDEDSTLQGVLKACRWLYPGQMGKFLLPPDTMYGEMGCDIIPKSARILLAVRSIKWVDAGAPKRFSKLEESAKKDFSTICDLAKKTNIAASDQYEHNFISNSISLSDDALKMLKCVATTQNHKNVHPLMSEAYINIAKCYLKMNEFKLMKDVLDSIKELENSSKNFQYLLLVGKYYYAQQRFHDAMKWYLKALEVEPKSAEVADELLKVDFIVDKYKSDELEFSKNIFSKEETEGNNSDNTTADIIKEFCEKLKISRLKHHPVPPTLIEEQIDIVKKVLTTINGVTIQLNSITKGYEFVVDQ